MGRVLQPVTRTMNMRVLTSHPRHHLRALGVPILGLLCVLLFAQMTACAKDGDRVTLRAIIDNVRENERLYENLDVSYESNYSTGNRSPRELAARKQEIMGEKLTFHAVSQDDLFRVDRHGTQTVGKQVGMNANSNIAFDGNTTRLLQNDGIGNIVKGRQATYDFLRPHTALISADGIRGVRLSTYLSGYEALMGDPNARWSADRDLECAYKGEVTFNQLDCHLVWVTEKRKKSQVPTCRWEFWLSERYNYIPVRILAYTFRWSTKLPLGEDTASDFREVKAGLWFPHSLRVESYEPQVLKDDGIRRTRWTRTFSVRKVSMDPHYDRAYFQDVKFPQGIPIYEVENNKIKRSYVLGDEAARSFRRFRELIILGASLLLGGAVVL